MGSLLLSIVQNLDDNNWYFDNKAESFIYAGIGILVVFAGILILIGVISLLGFIFKKLDEKGVLNRKTKKSKKKAEQAAAASEAVQQQPIEAASDEIPDEVKVAIMAAIMAYYQTEQPKCEFTVKRIKRI
ncbi:MAG: OadG family protein [Clostridia bacterium]|nr:OadG family protein [Clostridia bacterium]